MAGITAILEINCENISHLTRLGPFLSDVDKNNHVYWQNVNPKAIAIVFDHSFLAEEGNDGFEIFRLTNVNLGHKSDFHGVKFEVHAPEDKTIYRKFVDIANNVHREDPIMTEEGEIVDVFETMKIGSAQKPEEDDLKAYVLNNTTLILQTIRDLKKSVGGGVTRLQNWFEKALREGIKDPLGDLEYQLWDLTEKVKEATDIKEESETPTEEPPQEPEEEKK